jgi:hypothetical protein
MLVPVNEKQRINPERISSTIILEAMQVNPSVKRGFQVVFTMMDEKEKIKSGITETFQQAEQFINEILKPIDPKHQKRNG